MPAPWVNDVTVIEPSDAESWDAKTDPASDQTITGEWAFADTAAPVAASVLLSGMDLSTGTPEPDGDLLWTAVAAGSVGNLLQVLISPSASGVPEDEYPGGQFFGPLAAVALTDYPAEPFITIWVRPDTDEITGTTQPTASDVASVVAASPTVAALVIATQVPGSDGTGRAVGAGESLLAGEDTRQVRIADGVVTSAVTITPAEQNQTPLRLAAAPGSTLGTAILNIPHYDGTPDGPSGYGVTHLDSDGGGAFAGERLAFSEHGDLIINSTGAPPLIARRDGVDQAVLGGDFASLIVNGIAPAKRTQVMSQAPGQTADVVTSIDGDDGTTEHFRVRPSGAVITMGTEPADADLAVGQMATWYEPTGGAPVVHFKAKDSAGAVYVANLPMTPA